MSDLPRSPKFAEATPNGGFQPPPGFDDILGPGHSVPRHLQKPSHIVTEFQIAISDELTKEWGGKVRWFYRTLVDFCVPSPGLMIQSNIAGLGYYQVHDVTFNGSKYSCRLAEVGAPTNPEVQAQFLLDQHWEERNP